MSLPKEEQLVLFSIIIPTCGRDQMLQRAIDSVLAQTFKSFEIIVVDDSAGATPVALTDVHRQAIRYIRNTEGRGVSNARNVGIKNATGDWIVFLDDDDELREDYLQTLHDEIEAHKDVGLFWCGVQVVSASESPSPGDHGSGEPPATEEITEILYYSETDAPFIGASYGVALSRQVFEQCGMFDSEYIVGEDTEFFLRVLDAGVKVKPIRSVGVIKHESHAERLSYQFGLHSEHRVLDKICKKYSKYLSRHLQTYWYLLRWATIVHVRSNNFRWANSSLKEARKVGPLGGRLELRCFVYTSYLKSLLNGRFG